MDVTNILSELKISKLSAAWAFLSGGWAGLAKLICEAFSKLLQKAKPEELEKYATLAENVAKFINYGIELFLVGSKYKVPAEATVNAIKTLAEHIKDGKYTTEELDVDIDNIEAAIDAWKKV